MNEKLSEFLINALEYIGSEKVIKPAVVFFALIFLIASISHPVMLILATACFLGSNFINEKK